MIYKAFLNRQEITGFPVKGKETSEIWGGDTLLWKKEFGMQGEIERYNLSRIIHCGERAVLFFINDDSSDYGKDWTYFMFCTVKKTYPYYEKIYEYKPYEDGRQWRGQLAAVFNKELYIMLVYPESLSTKMILHIDNFLIYSKEMKLKSRHDVKLNIEINKNNPPGYSGTTKIHILKMWAENNKFHLMIAYYVKDYVPVSMETFVFEDGELIERQKSSKLIYNYNDGNNVKSWPLENPSTTVSLKPHNGDYYYVAVEEEGRPQLVEVSAKEPLFRVVSNTTKSDSYFAGCHNGRFLWRIDDNICESIENNYYIKCSDPNKYAKDGIAVYGKKYLCLSTQYSSDGGTILVARTGTDNSTVNDTVIYKTKHKIYLSKGIICENGIMYIYYRGHDGLGHVKMYVDMFRLN